MKPYRRNWLIGVIAMIFGAIIYFFTPSPTRSLGAYLAGGGIILAGWSGRVWVYEEKQKPIY